MFLNDEQRMLWSLKVWWKCIFQGSGDPNLLTLPVKNSILWKNGCRQKCLNKRLDLSLEISADFYSADKFSSSFTSESYFFLLCQSPSLSLCTVFDVISSNADEFYAINPSANVFVFRDFNAHHEDSLIH